MILTDMQLQELIDAKKVLPKNYREKLFPEKEGKREVDVYDETGRKYTIFIRQHSKFPDNFSVGLRYTFPQRSSSINLRRYNSKQIHRNTLEKQKIFGYHVHIATEKYQMAERKPEGYAEISEKFSNPREAFACLVKDCNLIRPESESMPLLELTNEK